MQIQTRPIAFAPRPLAFQKPREAKVQPSLLADRMERSEPVVPALIQAAPVEPKAEESQDKSKDLEKLILKVLADPEAEQQLIETLQFLNATKQLKPALHQLAGAALESGALPPMPEQKLNELVDQAAGMIDAQFRERGMTPDTVGAVYVDWPELSAQHLAAVRSTQAPPRMAGGLSLLSDSTFLSELESLQGAPFRAGNSVKVLTDGPASFAERERLIAGAKDSIHLSTWAIYDDETGWDTVRKLVEKSKEGVDVKVMVDGQVSVRSSHDAPVKFLEENGVPVMRWQDADRPYDGNHRKLMVVDGTEAIVGGINIGDVYSHLHGEQKWRDTDILYKGPAVDDSSKLFAKLWNEKAEAFGLPQTAEPQAKASIEGAVRSAVVDHVPGPEGDAHIMLSLMKAIEGATESVDIENAYFINTPGMKEVILKALEDGVKVRILTNSSESIDEPIVSGPILASLPELVAAGAEVYLKKGDTLHSKFMTVDGLFSSVGSHNNHPRSQRFEGETVVNSLDTTLARTLIDSFENDIAQAQKIEKPEDVKVPDSPFHLLAMRYFFDAL